MSPSHVKYRFQLASALAPRSLIKRPNKNRGGFYIYESKLSWKFQPIPLRDGRDTRKVRLATLWLWFLIAVCPSLSIPLLATGHTARRNQSSKTVKIVLKKFWWHTYRRKISRGSRIWGYFFDKPPQKWSKRAICFKFFEIWVFQKFLKSWINCIFWPFYRGLI